MNKESGYIKIYRKILEWEWYSDINTKTVFLHLLLTVNYKPFKWKGHLIGRGERVASFNTLSKEIGLSVQSVRTAISHLELTGEITRRKIPECTIISIKNYDEYQESTSELTGESTNDQQAANKRPTSDQHRSKKDKKGRREEGEENKKEIPPLSPQGENGMRIFEGYFFSGEMKAELEK